MGFVSRPARRSRTIAPSVDATRANLKTLLAYTLKHGYCEAEDNLLVVLIEPRKRKKHPALSASLQLLACYRSCICKEDLPASEDGLLEAIVYLKTGVQKYRAEGVCEACKGRYNLRMKADGMPYCERCMLTAAVGI